MTFRDLNLCVGTSSRLSVSDVSVSSRITFLYSFHYFLFLYPFCYPHYLQQNPEMKWILCSSSFFCPSSCKLCSVLLLRLHRILPFAWGRGMDVSPLAWMLFLWSFTGHTRVASQGTSREQSFLHFFFFSFQLKPLIRSCFASFYFLPG